MKVFKDKIVTDLAEVTEFWVAEEYHQKYLNRNPNGMKSSIMTHLNIILCEDFVTRMHFQVTVIRSQDILGRHGDQSCDKFVLDQV